MDPNISAEEIRRLIHARAHELWEAEGKPEGKHREHWLAAQKEVLEEVDRSGATGPADPAPSKPRSGTAKKQDELLDQAVEETFPASDPISPKKIT